MADLDHKFELSVKNRRYFSGNDEDEEAAVQLGVLKPSQ